MKLTKKSVTSKVETEVTVCEIAQSEFDRICADVAAKTVVQTIGDDRDADDVVAGLAMAALLAKFVSNLDRVLFNDKTENPDNKEEK